MSLPTFCSFSGEVACLLRDLAVDQASVVLVLVLVLAVGSISGVVVRVESLVDSLRS